MLRTFRYFWLVNLLFFSAGCSGYRVVGYSLPEITSETQQEIAADTKLQPGDRARVQLVDGSRAEGIVQALSSREITLLSDDEAGRTLYFSADQIFSVEKHTSSQTTTLILVTFILVIAGTIAMVPFDLISGM
ncbi:MAG: hypothetical protein ABFS42_05665 [Candidatus Krumholzibacteriota bacterium]